MPHLVEQVRPNPGEHISIEDCLLWITESRDFLVNRGKEALSRAGRLTSDPEWGSLVKREVVDINGDSLPKLIGRKLKPQTITEVINQTANISRLVDVLTWIVEERSDLNIGTIKACHPTTSSGPSHGDRENDLSLAMPDGSESHFEISDVSGDVDGNNKEFKSLVSLGCLPRDITKKKALNGTPLPRPEGRVFVAVTVELANVIRGTKKWWRTPPVDHVYYEDPVQAGNTFIFEVRVNE